MGKKKKKSQKKKKEKTEKETEKSSESLGISLGDALLSAKNTETTLQTLLKGASEQRFAHPKNEENKKITPHLSHESRSKIAEDYIMEDVPIIQRAREKKKSRTLLVPQEKNKTKSLKTSSKKAGPPPSSPSTQKLPIEAKLSKPRVPQKASKTLPPTESQSIQKAEEIAPSPTAKKEPSFVKKENIYAKLTEFFEGLLMSYNERYDRWENSISDILAILRKMRKITKKNTEDLVGSINNIFKKIQVDLGQFKIKRKEIEKVSEVDIESMSGEFKRVLGLLELQIKEYQLKRETDNFIREIRYNAS